MPPTNYGLLATACPAVQVPAVLPNPLAPASVPKTLPSFVSGTLAAAWLQQAMLSIEALAERGSGVYAVLSGFALTDGGGLNVRVGDGAAVIGGYVGKFTPITGYATAALVNAATNYIWIGQQGQINVNTSLTPPAGAWVYAGAAITAGSVITSFDLSGVVTLSLGGQPERRTADIGIPADTPPAGIRFIQHSVTTDYLWDGAKYRPLFYLDMHGWMPGRPNASEVLVRWITSRPFTLLAGLPLSLGKAGAAATGSTVFSLQKNGVQFGTATFAPAGTVAAFAAATDTAFAPGDLISIVAPASADATLADISLVLVGVL